MPSLTFVGKMNRSMTTADPVPSLKFATLLDIRGIDQKQPAYVVIERDATLTLGGAHLPNVRFEMGPVIGQYLQNDTNVGINLIVDVHRYLVDVIESKRMDDLSGTLTIDFTFLRQGSNPERASNSAEFTISEKEWTTLLGQAGYRTGWTAYIERGVMEGWTEVAGHVSEAHDRLLARDPTGVLVACRAAFRAADKVVSGDWADIAAQIDRGSKPESGYDPKSIRVKSLKEWGLKMADTGGHSESYNATSEDAEFVYGLTVDLLAYLSRKAAHAERSRKP
jgi:hypothetical protein